MGPAELQPIHDQAMPWRHSPTKLRRVRRLTVVLGAALILAVPVAVSASHVFSDVPTSSTYHLTTARLFGARITGGCGGTGKYCPNEAVTRGQMAAFLNRGLGRGAAGIAGLPNWDTLAAPDGGIVGSTDILSGGGAGGSALVLVSGNLNAWTDEPGVCPCEVSLVLVNQGTGEISPTIFEAIGADGVPTPDPGHPGLFWETNTTASWMFAVPSGTNNTFEMFALIATTNPATTPDELNGLVTGWVAGMQATYLPFGPDGGNPEIPATNQGNKKSPFQPRGVH